MATSRHLEFYLVDFVYSRPNGQALWHGLQYITQRKINNGCKSAILFYSNGTIWLGVPDITHVIKTIADSLPF